MVVSFVFVGMATKVIYTRVYASSLTPYKRLMVRNGKLLLSINRPSIPEPPLGADPGRAGGEGPGGGRRSRRHKVEETPRFSQYIDVIVVVVVVIDVVADVVIDVIVVVVLTFLPTTDETLVLDVYLRTYCPCLGGSLGGREFRGDSPHSSPSFLSFSPCISFFPTSPAISG